MGDSREPPPSCGAGGFADGIFPSPFGELTAAAVVCGAAVPASRGCSDPCGWLISHRPHSTGRWPAWTLLLASEVKHGELAGLACSRKRKWQAGATACHSAPACRQLLEGRLVISGSALLGPSWV